MYKTQAFTITINWLLVSTAQCSLHWTRYPLMYYITAHFHSHLDPLYQLMYCHHCTLLSSFGSTISSCTAITAHFYPHLDPLSAHVLSSLHTAISNWIYYQLLYYLPLLHNTIQYQLVYCKYCTLLSSMDPLSVCVLSSLHIAILTAVHLSAALLTLWHTAILIRIHYKLV